MDNGAWDVMLELMGHDEDERAEMLPPDEVRCGNCGENVEQRGRIWVHSDTLNTYCHDDDGPEDMDEFGSYPAPEATR